MLETKLVDLQWGDKAQTFIRWSFYGDWDGEAYFESLPILWKLIDKKSANDTLNLVVDMRQSGKTPSNLTALMRAAIRKQPHACSVQQVIVVSNGRFWESMHKIASRHSKKIAELNVAFVTNDNEVHSLLNNS